MKILYDAESSFGKKCKRVNKNKKKSWRKHIDISDIDLFQEEQRRDERLFGVLGGPIESKPSEELFCIDTEQLLEHPQKSDDKIKSPKILRREKLLKCHKFINGLPGAKAISQKQGEVKQRPPKIIRKAMKFSQNTLTKRRKLIKSQKIKRIERNNTDELAVDLWNQNDHEKLDMFGSIGKTYMDEPMEYYKLITKQNKPKVPGVRLEKPSALSAVIVPKPGASYNPCFEDHQALLAEAVKEEEKRLTCEQKEKRKVKKYAPPKDGGISYENWLQEMSAGLPIGDVFPELDDTLPQSDEEDGVAGKKGRGKKSKQARKKAQTIRIQDQRRLKRKALNQLESQVFRLKAYKKEIEAEAAKKLITQKNALKKKKEKRFQTKTLSRNKFQEQDIPVQFGSELCSSLLTVEPMGNPTEDCYKHLQRRNLLDTRVKIKRVKAKRKDIKKKNLKEDMKNYIDSLFNKNS